MERIQENIKTNANREDKWAGWIWRSTRTGGIGRERNQIRLTLDNGNEQKGDREKGR